ncbi:MAG TPA: MFS transporter [Rhodospirillaceae bacterium]|nr:MFS transporter [Rhodospirillaceae bacterium]
MSYTDRHGVQFLFLNIGHLLDHFFLLIYATAVLSISLDPAFQLTFATAIKDFLAVLPFEGGAVTAMTEWANGLSEESSYGFLLALSTASFIAFGAFSIPAGWLGDKWSKHGMITVFFIGIGSSAVITGFANGPYQVAAGLLAIGVFAAIYHPVGIAMVAENAKSLGKELGINGVFGNVGVACAAVVTGFLADQVGWRAAFILPGVVSIAMGLAYLWFSRNAPEPHPLAKKDKFIGASASEVKRAIAVVLLASAPGMLIFNSTTNSLPKLFDERLGGFAANLSEVGMWTFGVFLIASVAQVIMGHLLDKYRLKPIYLIAVALQAPLIFLVGYAHGIGVLGSATAMMFIVFSIIPIHDTIIARFTSKEIRSRVFALKYLVGLMVGAAALPLTGWLHSAVGGFTMVFMVLGALAIFESCVTFFLPARDHLTQAEPAAQPAE